jgi:hypothetical protein
MTDCWIWLARATNGTPLLVNLSNVSHMDPGMSPTPSTTHLSFGTDDDLYAIEVRGSPEEICDIAGFAPVNTRDHTGIVNPPRPARPVPIEVDAVREGEL